MNSHRAKWTCLHMADHLSASTLVTVAPRAARTYCYTESDNNNNPVRSLATHLAGVPDSLVGEHEHDAVVGPEVLVPLEPT